MLRAFEKVIGRRLTGAPEPPRCVRLVPFARMRHRLHSKGRLQSIAGLPHSGRLGFQRARAAIFTLPLRGQAGTPGPDPLWSTTMYISSTRKE